MTNSSVENVNKSAFWVLDAGFFSINNNDISKGIDGTVQVENAFQCNTISHLDFTNNYWGTDNPDSIEAWIHDYNDSDKACYTIDYQPFRGVSTPTKKRSMGSLKAMFR